MSDQRLARLAVLISGSGTNLQAILDACATGDLPARVVVVAANRPDAYGLQRAARAGVPVLVKEKNPAEDRRAYDAGLARLVADYAPDCIVLAGWMRILTAAFLDVFRGRVVNLHPALPGAFPGTHAIQRAYEAFRGGEIQSTGVMVHLVPDEGVDCGPVIATETVPIMDEDTAETLEARIHQVEHRLLLRALNDILPTLTLEIQETR